MDAMYFAVGNPATGEYVPATTIIESLLWTPTLWPMFTEKVGIQLTVTQPGTKYASTAVSDGLGDVGSDPPSAYSLVSMATNAVFSRPVGSE
jgi:hypothetical protein